MYIVKKISFDLFTGRKGVPHRRGMSGGEVGQTLEVLLDPIVASAGGRAYSHLGLV